jgi:hypothetical protein
MSNQILRLAREMHYPEFNQQATKGALERNILGYQIL